MSYTSGSHIGSTFILYLGSDDFSLPLLPSWPKSASTVTWIIGVASYLSLCFQPCFLIHSVFNFISQINPLKCVRSCHSSAQSPAVAPYYLSDSICYYSFLLSTLPQPSWSLLRERDRHALSQGFCIVTLA